MRLLLWLIIFALVPRIGLAATPADSYKECSALSNQNPAQALALADSLLQQNDSASARHCRAMALFALSRYGEAANELSTVAQRIRSQDITLWTQLAVQGARSYELAGSYDKANALISEAITALSSSTAAHVVALTVEMLRTRSRLLQASGDNLQAVQDLDQAHSLMPDNVDVLLERARLFVALKETDLASQDAAKILTLQPGNQEAAALRDYLAAKN